MPIEDTINAVTFGLTLEFPDIANHVSLDDDLVRSIVHIASRSDDAPRDLASWADCLDQGMRAFVAVRDRRVQSLVLDVNKRLLVIPPS